MIAVPAHKHALAECQYRTIRCSMLDTMRPQSRRVAAASASLPMVHAHWKHHRQAAFHSACRCHPRFHEFVWTCQRARPGLPHRRFRDFAAIDEHRGEMSQGMGPFGRPGQRCSTPSRGRLGYIQSSLYGLLLVRTDVEDHRDRIHIGAGLPAGHSGRRSGGQPVELGSRVGQPFCQVTGGARRTVRRSRASFLSSMSRPSRRLSVARRMSVCSSSTFQTITFAVS